MPQVGHATQNCERAAGTRGRATQTARVAPHGVTCLGDDLSSHQPLWALGLHNRCNVILTGKPDSHPTVSERLALWQATGGRAEHAGQVASCD